MVTRRFAVGALLAACGGSKTPERIPSHAPPPTIDAGVPVLPLGAAVVPPDAAPAKKSWSREALPVWKPVPQDLKSATEDAVTARSEERRVGKEWRYGGVAED